MDSHQHRTGRMSLAARLQRHDSIHGSEQSNPPPPPSTLAIHSSRLSSLSSESTEASSATTTATTTSHSSPSIPAFLHRNDSVRKLFHYSKTVANDVKHSMSKLIKSIPSQELPLVAVQPSMYPQHEPLYFRSSSPLFAHHDVKQMIYANSARYHHSVPLSSEEFVDSNFRKPPPFNYDLSQRRLYKTFDSQTIDQPASPLPAANKSDIQTVMLDKLSSEIDIAHRDTGGIVLCGGTEVGK